MKPARLIAAKRDGKTLDAPDIDAFVRAFLDESVADYQMTAFLMAVAIRGMTSEETAALTRVMIETGDVLDWSGLPGKPMDKHSTGGVGDLISLPLAPAVAACGVPVPMISGRGLGHTGGTLDKLESIPGLSTALSPDRFAEIVRQVGFAMGGQTPTLAPADRRMYALRDVTGTVESIPLIVSSILSKKVAEGIEGLVLDVKCGAGAFMKTEDDALALARELVRTGTLLGKRVVAFLTDMSRPLGDAVGNAVEVEAGLRVLRGEGHADVATLVRTLGTAMLRLGGAASSWADGEAKLQQAIGSGEARNRFRAMVEAQGGDAGAVDDPGRLPQASATFTVKAREAGTVAGIDPLALGHAVIALGGGRTVATDTIDPAVGIRLATGVGDRVEAGAALATVLAADASQAESVGRDQVAPAIRIGEPVPVPDLVRMVITADGETPWRAGAEGTELA